MSDDKKTPTTDLREENRDPDSGWAHDRVPDKDLRDADQSIEQLRVRYEKLEAKVHKLQADKDDALQKVRDRFFDRLREANDDLAAAQKALADAEAAQALVGRPDAELIAANLGLTLPE
jgi:chromosome segregation ATPase